MKKKIQSRILLFFMFLGLVFPLSQFSQGLAEKGWPKFQGPSLQNNGRSPYLGTDTPDIKWSIELGDNFKMKSISIGPDGVIYVGTNTKLLAFIDKGAAYKEKWGINISKPNHVTISSDGYLFVGTSNCVNERMYKIAANNGDIIWEYDLSQYSACGTYPATIANDGTILFGIGGYSTRYLFALNQDGTEKWKIPFGDNVETLPSIEVDGKYVYAGNNDNELYIVDLETGDIVNQDSPPGGRYIYGHVAIGENGDLYLTSATYGTPYIYSYKPNLESKWIEALGADHYVVPPSIDYNNVIYTGGLSTNKLFALDDTNGSEKWSYLLDGDFISPPVIDTNNTIYVVTGNFLYAIDSQENPGTLKWKFPQEGNLSGQGFAQPAISEDGTIYLPTKNGTLYAIGNKNIDAAIDIDPDTLNKKSKGKWVTAYIAMPDGYDAGEIDIDTVELEYDNQKIVADRGDVQGTVLMVKFDRQALISLLNDITGDVELKITGTVTGTAFEGTDTIRVK